MEIQFIPKTKYRHYLSNFEFCECSSIEKYYNKLKHNKILFPDGFNKMLCEHTPTEIKEKCVISCSPRNISHQGKHIISMMVFKNYIFYIFSDDKGSVVYTQPNVEFDVYLDFFIFFKKIFYGK